MELKALDLKGLEKATDKLCRKEPAFARVVKQYGYPPLWQREEGFVTLLHIILEQQVSLESAQACLDKLLKATKGNLTPKKFLNYRDEDLRSFGFSRQKSRYSKLLADRFLKDKKVFDELPNVSDKDAQEFLTSLVGIGPWSAQVYMLMVLRRPDIWPIGDRALVVAAKEIFELEAEQTQDELREFAQVWAPHRSTAARILWLGYLGKRGKI